MCSDGLEELGRDDVYIIVDCPGQIELYTHLPVMKVVSQVGFGCGTLCNTLGCRLHDRHFPLSVRPCRAWPWPTHLCSNACLRLFSALRALRFALARSVPPRPLSPSLVCETTRCRARRWHVSHSALRACLWQCPSGASTMGFQHRRRSGRWRSVRSGAGKRRAQGRTGWRGRRLCGC